MATVHVSRRTITLFLTLLTAIVLLPGLAIDLLPHALEITSPQSALTLMSLDREFNIPTSLSAGLLFAASFLLVLISRAEHSRGAQDTWRWSLLSAGLALMAMDEIVSLHERLVRPVRAFLDMDTMGLFYFAWVVPGIVLVVAAAIIYARFLLRQDPIVRNRVILAALVYLGGALGMEMVGGRYAELHGLNNLPYWIIVSLEEVLEFAGAILLIDALLRYLERMHPRLELVLSGVRDRAGRASL